MTIKKLTASAPAPGVPFYTPAQEPPVGTALNPGADVPTIFTPLKLRGLNLQNRFVVSPMCMYSADDGRYVKPGLFMPLYGCLGSHLAPETVYFLPDQKGTI